MTAAERDQERYEARTAMIESARLDRQRRGLDQPTVATATVRLPPAVESSPLSRRAAVEPCAQCGVPLSGTYWHLQGRHYCEACGDGLVWTRLPSGEFAWLRP